MKACQARTDVAGLLAPGSEIDSRQVKKRETHTTTFASRRDRVRVLKEQVDAGTYSIDSQALARKMQMIPLFNQNNNWEF